MSKNIVFLNMKGGVGKTTMAVNIAQYLSIRKGKSVLLIDLDPQYNATQYLVDTDKHPEFVNGKDPTVLDIMMPKGFGYKSILNGEEKIHSKEDIKLKDVVRTIWSGNLGKLDLIPGTIHLINLEMAARGVEHRLQNFIKKIGDAYDFIFVDCPPTYSIFLLSGILSCDYYLVPVKPDPLSVLGVPLLETVIDFHCDNFGKEIEPIGIIFTMVRETNMMTNVMAALQQTSVGERYIFENYTRNSTYYAESSRNHEPLFEHYLARYHGHASDMNKIVDEFLFILK